MEDDNEVLDWGNEDDEQQHEGHRKASVSDLDAKRASGDLDDVEDSVSLGDDEEDQDFYAFQQRDSNGDIHATSHDTDAGSRHALTPKSSTFPRDNSNNQSQSQQRASRELRREDSTHSQKVSSTGGSPQRRYSGNHHDSPSQRFSTRITHALPPKPVVANVPFLHPSHPSIVEATAMSRIAGRNDSNKNKSNGNSGPTTSGGGGGPKVSANLDSDSPPLLPDWEARHARTGGRGVYYYNVQTHQSTWSRPVSSSNSTSSLKESRSTSSRPRRGSSVSAGGSRTSPKSDHYHPQSIRTGHGQSQPQSDFAMEDSQKPLEHASTPASTSGLSYEDRHYRPDGGDDVTPTVDSRREDRNVENLDSRYNPQRDEAFTPPTSPSQSRERRRSLSPVPLPPAPLERGRERPSRGSQRSSRGMRNTNTDTSSQRDREGPPAAHDSSGRYWGQPPYADSNSHNHHQAAHHQHPQRYDGNRDSQFESFEDRERFAPRNNNNRGRNREREQSRPVMHEQQQNQNQNQNENISAHRHRSPPPHLRDREQNYEGRRDYEKQAPPPPVVVPAPIVGLPHPNQPEVHKHRDRPSRFDRPPPPPPIAVVIPPSVASAIAEKTNAQHDSRKPTDMSVSQRRGEERLRDHSRDVNPDEMSSASHQFVADGNVDPQYPNKRTRLDDHDSDHGMQSSDQGRKRPPLPPQSLRFREMATRPPGAPPVVDHNPNREMPQASPLQGTAPLPLGPRDHHHRPSNPYSGPPSGPRYQAPPSRPDTDFSFNAGRAPPSGPSGNSNIDVNARTRGDRDRRAPTSHSHATEIGMDVDPAELPSPSRNLSHPPPRISANNNETIRAGSGMYADRESAGVGAGDVPPRGPRAMASRRMLSTEIAPASIISASPVSLYDGSRGRDRDRDRLPPLNDAGKPPDGRRDYFPRQNDVAPSWKDEFRQNQDHHHPMERGQSRREPRGRPEFPRPPPSGSHLQLSGTNSVPIGNRKGGLGGGDVAGPIPPGNRYGSNFGAPLGVSGANMEPIRDMRRPPMDKEPYERQEIVETTSISLTGFRHDSYDSPSARHHPSPSNGPPMRMPQQSRRDYHHYPPTDHHTRFDQHPAGDLMLGRTSAPRTWTPRDHTPPRDIVARDSFNGGDHRPPTPPPLTRESSLASPTWHAAPYPTDRNRPPRYPDNAHQQSRSEMVRPPLDVDVRHRLHLDEQQGRGRERFAPPPHSESLEGRLGERFEDSFIEPPFQSPGLPLPLPRKSFSPENRRQPPHPEMHRRADSFVNDRPRPGWDSGRGPSPGHLSEFNPQHPRTFDEQPSAPERSSERDFQNTRPSKPVRIRRPPSTTSMRQDETMRPEPVAEFDHPHPPRDRDDQISVGHSQRPEIPRRGGSLLDRLSLDQGESPLLEDEAPPQSLRDRVSVPLKRDRDDMISGGSGDYYSMDASFDGDDSSMDPAMKRARRRSGKIRRGGGKRGGPP